MEYGSKQTAMEVMRRQQLLVTKLRALVLPLLPAGDPSTELVAHLFQDVIGCTTSVISKLQLLAASDHGAMQEEEEEEEERHNKGQGHKRRRNEKQYNSVTTDAPHYDGHQWRKYGQKSINGMHHPRSYYRCTYNKEQNCMATKTIQQQGNNNSSTSIETSKYTVVYYGSHTCKQGNEHNVEHPYIMDPDQENLIPMSLEAQEFAMNDDSEVSILLQEFIDEPMDPCSWMMDEMICFQQARSPVYVGGFSF